MTEPATWYTDDVTLYSYGTLLRMSLRQGVVAGPLIFLFFAFRKAIGWRFRPTYGTALPDRLPIIPGEQIPEQVRQAMAPALAACREAGFIVCFAVKPALIGGKSAHFVGMLDRAGTTYATAIWFRLTVGRQSGEKVVLSCHSRTFAETELHTGPTDASADRGLIMPGYELLELPPDATPDDAISAHARRIGSRADLVHFKSDSLAVHVLAEQRRYFQWRIEQGYLVPLTPSEVRRLGGEPV